MVKLYNHWWVHISRECTYRVGKCQDLWW
jgi:hypothetical protein